MKIKVITETTKYIFDNFNSMQAFLLGLDACGIDYFILITKKESKLLNE